MSAGARGTWMRGSDHRWLTKSLHAADCCGVAGQDRYDRIGDLSSNRTNSLVSSLIVDICAMFTSCW